jgi:acyl transferase domain-containing protein
VTGGAPGTGLEVAVVGMGGRFPGGGGMVDDLWSTVAEGREAISFFRPEELSEVPAAERTRPDYVPAYGMLADIDRFDAAFFGYSPRDARLLDPQQRLFLECAWEAIEAAGWLVPAGGELVGVYAATGPSSYLLRHLLGNPAVTANVSEYELMLANDKDSLATRAAYHLDLRGPAVAVQTACSSSLVAVHLACQGLLARECDVALAGGVHIRLPARAGYRYEPGGIMSRDGHCRPFDADASGTVGGSGVAVVVLRRLADALRDGDRVYAVILGSAVNNDGGRKVGYTAPAADGQAAVIRAAQRMAEIDPGTIGYLEAHGTGTDLGDQIELQALRQAFRAGTDRRGFCALGSVKALVGHLDTAAGVTGLIKASLALHHGLLPPSPYFRAPSAGADLADSPFYLTTEPRDWPDLGGPRRAGVSSFGIGGTNAHVVLEQAPAAPDHPSTREDHLLVLSAPTGWVLDQMRQRLREHLRATDEPLADVAYTLQVTRRGFPYRLAVACRDRPEAVTRLDAAASARPGGTELAVAFLFPGQGAQQVDMGRDLYRTEPAFRRALDECAERLRPHLGRDLREVMYPPASVRAAAAELLRQTWLTQPALFTVEYALAQLWAQWGVSPAAMLGHSVGEYVAACLAGVFTLPDALAAVATRGRLMYACAPGVMLSVPLPPGEVEPLLPEGVTLAAANAPRLSVVAGPATAVERVASGLAGRGVSCRRLQTSHAFHSPMMDPVVDQFADYLRGVTLRPPRIPVGSNVTGDWQSPEQATDPGYWARQLRAPVRFEICAQRLLAEPRALLEVGPGSTLGTLIRQQPAARDRTVVASLGRTGPDGTAFAGALGQLWAAGVPVDWPAGWRHERRRRVPLPTYPFQRERCWVDPPAAAGAHPAELPAAATGSPVPARPAPQPPAASTPTQPSPDQLVRSAQSSQESVRRIWRDLLGVAEIGPDEDFFALGGHSLLATQVVARIRDTLAVDLPPNAIFEAPTIAGLAAAVDELTSAGIGPAELPTLLAEVRAMSPDQLRRELAAARRESPG